MGFIHQKYEKWGTEEAMTMGRKPSHAKHCDLNSCGEQAERKSSPLPWL